MSKDLWFASICLLIVIVSGIICFKRFKNLFKSIFWLLFPNSVSVWSKKLLGKDVENTFRFEVFAVLVAALIGLTYLIFRYIL